MLDRGTDNYATTCKRPIPWSACLTACRRTRANSTRLFTDQTRIVTLSRLLRTRFYWSATKITQWIRKNWIRILKILSAYLLFIFAGADWWLFSSYSWNITGFHTAGIVLNARLQDRWTNPGSRRMRNRTRLLIRFHRYRKLICHLTFQCLELEVMSVKSWRNL